MNSLERARCPLSLLAGSFVLVQRSAQVQPAAMGRIHRVASQAMSIRTTASAMLGILSVIATRAISAVSVNTGRIPGMQSPR